MAYRMAQITVTLKFLFNSTTVKTCLQKVTTIWDHNWKQNNKKSYQLITYFILAKTRLE